MTNPMSLHTLNGSDLTTPQNAFVVFVHSSVDIQPMNQTSRLSGLEHKSMVPGKWM